MAQFLAKRWFLLAMLAGIGLAFLRPDWLRPAADRLHPLWVVGSALFLMSWGLETRRLLQALARPWPAVWAIVISYTVVPGFGWLAGWLQPNDDFRIGLLISASAPCTLASAVLWTRMAGGNEATAMLSIILGTGTSWIATTAWLGPAVSGNSGTMMVSLLLVLVLPVALGQLSRAVPGVAAGVSRYQGLNSVASRLLVLSIIVLAAVDVAGQLRVEASELTVGALLTTAVLSVAAHLAALFAGFWSARALRFDRGDGIAVAFACSQKTLPVSLYLYHAYFKQQYPLALVPVVFYHVGQLVVDTFIADWLLEPARATSPPPAANGATNELG